MNTLDSYMKKYNKKYAKYEIWQGEDGKQGVYKCIKCKEIWEPTDNDIDPDTHTTYNMKCRECRLKLLHNYTRTLGLNGWNS